MFSQGHGQGDAVARCRGAASYWSGFALIALCFASPVWAVPAKAPDVGQKITELGQTQSALSVAVGRLQEQLQGVDARLKDLQDQGEGRQEADSADREQVKAMREEVRGLYVESSSTKEMVGKVGEQVAELSDSLERFRFAAGLLMAVLLGLQIVTLALTFRSR